MLEFLKYIFQLIIAPGSGWEDIAKDGRYSSVIALHGLSRTLIVVALSSFMTLLYSADATFVTVLSEAVVLFVLYWVTYFFADTVFSLFIGKMTDGAVDDDKVKTYIAYNVAILSLMALISNLLPFSFAIVQLFPIYVAIIMWKGTKYLKIFYPLAGKFMLLAIASVILPPVLIGMLFEMLL